MTNKSQLKNCALPTRNRVRPTSFFKARKKTEKREFIGEQGYPLGDTHKIREGSNRNW